MQRVYIDTTVPSAFFDGRTPDRQCQTQEFWKRLPSYEAVISALVLGEIHDTPDPDRRKDIENLVGDLPVLPLTDEAEILADEYLRKGAIPSKYRDDALHVAIAVVHQVQLLASWNFHHLVNQGAAVDQPGQRSPGPRPDRNRESAGAVRLHPWQVQESFPSRSASPSGPMSARSSRTIP